MKAITGLMLLLAAGIPAASGEPLPFEDGDTLEEIRYKIDYNGYCFEVADTWVYRLPLREKAVFFSRRSNSLPAAEARAPDPRFDRLLQQPLPPSFDWRDINGHSYIGPVRDQGRCGSCYAFGAAAAAEGAYNYALGLYDSAAVDFSEGYIAWCLGRQSEYKEHFYGCDGADYSYSELTALCQVGITYESDYPYTEEDPGACSIWSYPLVKFRNWYRVECNDVEAIKAAILNYGPVDAAVYAGGAFSAYAGGVYEDDQTSCYAQPCFDTTTNHSVSLIGWDDQPPEGGSGCWILRNSWGPGWGEEGYMRIRYTSARVACAICYLDTGLTPVPTPAPGAGAPGDYDGDGTTDLAVFRAAKAFWQVRGVTGFYFGSSEDSPVPGDYNGDGTWEAAYFRPARGLWKIREASGFYFGASDDIPVPGDYDGDGGWEPAFFRRASGFWKIRDQTSCYFGTSGDLPVPGDYDGDGALNLACVRPVRGLGLWRIKDGRSFYFGRSSDIPVPGDFDGDGFWEAAFFRPAGAFWKIYELTHFYFGASGDLPVPGDYDGDGTMEAGCFREEKSCLWKLGDLSRVYFGQSEDVPVNR